MYRESKRNVEFLEFFKAFKEKNKGKWASIINGMEVDPEILAEETQAEFDEKYKVYDQIHKRKQLNVGFEEFNKIAKDKYQVENNQVIRENEFMPPSYKGFDDEYYTKRDKIDDVMIALAPIIDKGENYDSRKFHLIFLEATMVCNVTPLNRVYHRKVLIFAGNKEGMIGYGVGIAPLYEDAWINSFAELKKNLILIEWDPNHTTPLPIKARFNDYRWSLRPTYKPAWFAGPIPLLMMRYAGMYHQNFLKYSRNKNPYAMVFSMFKGLTKNTTPKIIAETRAMKVKHFRSKRIPINIAGPKAKSPAIKMKI